MVSASATGKVKVYQAVVGSILLLIVPISYIALKMGAEAYAVFVVHIGIALIAFVVRLFIIRKMICLSVREYLRKAIMPCFFVAIPSIALSLLAKFLFPDGLLYAVLVVVVSLSIVMLFSATLGLTKNERKFVWSKLARVKARI